MRLLILGVGNPLMGDDGFGVAAVRELASEPLPEGVAIVEGGTRSLALTDDIEAAEDVLILDAADMGKPPGTLVEFTPAEVQVKAAASSFSLHQVDLWSTLRLLIELGTCPPIRIIAVQPTCVDYGIGLSTEVRAALPRALEIVRRAIRNLG